MCFGNNRFEKKKVQRILPRSCDEEYVISIALNCRLTDKSSVNKKYIRPAAVNRASTKLTKITQFNGNVTLNEEWADVSQQSDQNYGNSLLTKMQKIKNMRSKQILMI